MTAAFSYYDPHLDWSQAVEPFFPASPAWEAEYHEPYAYAYALEADPYVSGAAAIAAPPAQHAAAPGLWESLREFGHDLGQLPSAISDTATLARTSDKAGRAADTVTQQANIVGDDARKAFRAAESTANAVKFVVLGVGGLAALALFVHVIKTAVD